jgi:hypothetical protein
MNSALCTLGRRTVSSTFHNDIITTASFRFCNTFLTKTMPVELKGSCHCGSVKFSVQSSTPVPYQVFLGLEDSVKPSDFYTNSRSFASARSVVRSAELEDL